MKLDWCRRAIARFGAARHPPPGSGEHTEDVLQSVGFSAAEIQRLRDGGSIK
jgi:crotonobetainyl-CoA:carnitine CoA-transferase CaiB-like acyl-CoA transferase